MDNLMKLQQQQASVPPAALVPPAASAQHANHPEEPSLSLKRRSEASPSTPPVAKRPTLEAQHEEPIDAAPISSAPPTSRAPEASATTPDASNPPENTELRSVVFTPPSKAIASA